jgi:hypothetical protein
MVILITDLGQERDGRSARGEREKESDVPHCVDVENLNLVVERAVREGDRVVGMHTAVIF